VATHYDVLGIRASATPAQVRQAYVDKARQLHPDGYGGRPEHEIDAARRAMQDVNEAWRVLREPASRAEYDRSLREPAPTSRQLHPSAHDEWLDRPYPRHAAEPGDLTVAVVRAVPWIAVLVVLGAIFVFTAFARHDGAGGDGLIGKCVVMLDGKATQRPCDGPNDGRVVGVVREANLCTSSATPNVAAGGKWYCLRPADSG
jgi:curved DNA-binding protein CbpA